MKPGNVGARRTRLAVAALMLLHVALAGSSAAGESVTIADAVQNALHKNRDLLAARKSVEIARGQLIQAGLWSNPSIEADGKTARLIPGDFDRTIAMAWAQEFPVTHRLALAKDVSRVDVALALTEIRNRERLLIGQVEEAFLDLLVLDRQIALREDARAVNSRFLEALQMRFKAAEVSQADINQASIEVLQATQEIARLQVERDTRERSLKLLLGMETSQPLDVAGELDALLDGLTPKQSPSPDGFEGVSRPDLRQFELSADRALAETRLAQAEIWGDWKASLGFENERSVLETPAGVARNRDNLVTFTLSIPFPLKNRNQGRIHEQGALAGQANAGALALRLGIESEVAAARERADRLRIIVESLRGPALTLASRNVELLQQGFAQGLTSVTQVLLAQQQRFSLQASYLEALSSYTRALVELETAAGTSPFLNRDFLLSDPGALADTALSAP